MDPVAWAVPRITALARGDVLDVGCGGGRFLPAGAVGLDLDREQLRLARGRSPRVVQADAHALPFAEATFDTVLANRMLNDAGRIDLVLGEIARVLRPGGTLIVLTRARRRAEADRVDPENGSVRLGRYFADVAVERHGDGALFAATRKRAR